ncbi:MAG: glycosyltransferase family A protein [Sphingomonadales bacterium]|jgi:glycosyltransferase involved in cell wall biosynthesis
MTLKATSGQINGVVEDGLLSILIPSHNYGRFLPFTVESVIAQDYGPIELIIVDDGSSDDSYKIAKELLAGSDRFVKSKVVPLEKNRGKLGAINEGMAYIHGEYCIILDADDLLDANYASRCIEELNKARKKDQKVAFVYTDCHLISEAGEEIDRGRSTAFKPELIKQYSFIPEPAVVLTEILKQAGPFDESIRRGTKHHKWQRIINNGWWGQHIAEPMFCYRMHGNNLSGIGQRVIGEIQSGQGGERILSGYWPTVAGL